MIQPLLGRMTLSKIVHDSMVHKITYLVKFEDTVLRKGRLYYRCQQSCAGKWATFYPRASALFFCHRAPFSALESSHALRSVA